MWLFFLLFFELLSLFFISRLSTNQLFYFLRKFIKDEKRVFSLVSLFYLPGTIVHEMAHFLAATILFLKVKEVKIFPEFKKNSIKLGSVWYEKKDFVRGFFVGIAPLFAAVFFFYLISFFKLFPSSNLFQNLFFVYIIFVVSSTMFSSKQDLVDFVFFVPFIFFIAAIGYIFQINLNFVIDNQKIFNILLESLKDVNFYLVFSLIVNFFFFIILKLIASLKG